MKSPLYENFTNFRSLKTLKKLIPPYSTVNSFLFFDGKQELGLAEDRRHIIAHTIKYPVYEFWRCVFEDPHRIAAIAETLFADLKDENIFAILQEQWPSYKDPYIRSALFFILNRCSENGYISIGKMNSARYNPLSLAYLKRFKTDEVEIVWDRQEEFIDTVRNLKKSQYLLFPVGKFNYNLFEYGKNKGYEMTTIHHKKLHETLEDINERWIVLYKNHPRVHVLYKDYNLILLDKYGRETKEQETCEEIVIANF